MVSSPSVREDFHSHFRKLTFQKPEAVKKARGGGFPCPCPYPVTSSSHPRASFCLCGATVKGTSEPAPSTLPPESPSAVYVTCAVTIPGSIKPARNLLSSRGQSAFEVSSRVALQILLYGAHRGWYVGLQMASAPNCLSTLC